MKSDILEASGSKEELDITLRLTCLRSSLTLDENAIPWYQSYCDLTTRPLYRAALQTANQGITRWSRDLNHPISSLDIPLLRRLSTPAKTNIRSVCGIITEPRGRSARTLAPGVREIAWCYVPLQAMWVGGTLSSAFDKLSNYNHATP